MFRRRFYRHAFPHLRTTLIIILINGVASRSIEPVNLTIDRSEVPARYVFEIEEVQDELLEMKKNTSTEKGNSNSDLIFHMPIALAVFSAVLLLVCCFCCLRCAVTYDGINRSGTYGKLERSNGMIANMERRYKSNTESMKK